MTEGRGEDKLIPGLVKVPAWAASPAWGEQPFPLLGTGLGSSHSGRSPSLRVIPPHPRGWEGPHWSCCFLVKSDQPLALQPIHA